MKQKLKNFIIQIFPGLITDKAEGFPDYLKKSRLEGMDVNEWIDQNLGWKSTLPVLEQLAFPYIDNNPKATVCELGVGTGRQARYFVQKDNVAELHLVDYSLWIVNFLKSYF